MKAQPDTDRTNDAAPGDTHGSLRAAGLVKRYGGRTVVDIDELVLGRHGIEGLIGPNGAGKTTLMSLLTRTKPANAGAITYRRDGVDVDLMPLTSDAVARLGIVKTNQVISDFATLTIRDSLLLAAAADTDERFWRLGREGDVRAEARDEIDGYLSRFPFAHPDGHARSAGEKKLLDILRCLLLRPRMLLMDEPTAGLPDDITTQVMELMREVVDETGMAIVIVEHDLDLIWSVCDSVHFMAEGQVLEHGPPDQLRASEVVAEHYLGARRG